MAATSFGTPRHVDRRFIAATVALPMALVCLSGPALSATSRLSRHAVTQGAVAVNPFGFVVVAVGSVVTTTLVLTALVRRLPLERPRYAPMPLTFACAVVAAALFVGALPPTTPASIAAVATFAGLGVGSLIGRSVARALLDLADLPTSAGPAPLSAVRYPISQRATAVWVGRLPSVRLTSSLLLVAPVLFVWMLVPAGLPAMLVVVELPLAFVGHALARANRRLWVTIGRSGVQLRSGLLQRLRLSVDIEHITAASTTEIQHPRLSIGLWYSNAQRLRVTTRTGPALRLCFADDTEVVISMLNPAEPAGVLNTLLDQRWTLNDAADVEETPTC